MAKLMHTMKKKKDTHLYIGAPSLSLAYQAKPTLVYLHSYNIQIYMHLRSYPQASLAHTHTNTVKRVKRSNTRLPHTHA